MSLVTAGLGRPGGLLVTRGIGLGGVPWVTLAYVELEDGAAVVVLETTVLPGLDLAAVIPLPLEEPAALASCSLADSACEVVLATTLVAGAPDRPAPTLPVEPEAEAVARCLVADGAAEVILGTTLVTVG